MISLYHGSNVKIEKIVLSKSHKGKDFGQGFYLSDDKNQTMKMAVCTYEREQSGAATVSSFEFDENNFVSGELNVKTFEGYSAEWADFILMNRQNKTDNPAHDYDIVIGPIADDQVGVQIRRLERGYITKEIFLEEIKFIHPTIQYFFGTEKAINRLNPLKP